MRLKPAWIGTLVAACGGAPEAPVAVSGSEDGPILPRGPSLGASGNSGTGGSSAHDECGGILHRAQSKILDLHILMDRSASMIGSDSSFPSAGVLPKLGQDVWTPVGAALGSFVTSPQSAGMGIGIQFFPLPTNALIERQTCSADYSQPAAPIAFLPDNGAAIRNAIRIHGPPSGGTPTEPAFAGAMDYAKSWAKGHPSHKVALVLVTDGEPNHCGSSARGVARAAAIGLDDADGPAVETYVVSIGHLEGLQEIAEGGGTGEAIVISRQPEHAFGDFLAALDTIRSRAIPCDYVIPPEAQGAQELINVEFTPANGRTERIPFVQGGCDGAGWYYDDPQTPTHIVACPETCRRITETAGGRVDFVVGCGQTVK